MLEPRPDTPDDLARRLDALGHALRSHEPCEPPPALHSLVHAAARARLLRTGTIAGGAALVVILVIAASWRSIVGTPPPMTQPEEPIIAPTFEALRRLNRSTDGERVVLPPPVPTVPARPMTPTDARDPAAALHPRLSEHPEPNQPRR